MPLLALAFCAGISLASKIHIVALWLYPICALLLLACSLSFNKQRLFSLLILGLAFFLGALCLINSQIHPKCHISKFFEYKNKQPYIIKGFIGNKPELNQGKLNFILISQTMQSGNFNYACCGKVLVRAKCNDKISYGDDLILRGKLFRPFKGFSAQGRSYRDYLHDQDIEFIMNVPNQANIKKLRHNSGMPLKRFALWLEEKLESTIFRNNSFLTAAVLDAMVLGEKKNIPPIVNSSMMKTGTIHILVVSGFNVGIVSFIILMLLKLIRIPRRARFLIAIICIIIYCLMTGASNPVVRATVMAIVFMTGFLLKRESNIGNSLSLAALFILAQNPRQLFDIGFQLSFVSVLSIVYIYPKIKSLLPERFFSLKLARFFMEGLLVSLSAWLGTMGFIAYYFGIFSPVTIIANLFIVPLSAVITLCGFTVVFSSLLSAELCAIFANSAELVVTTLLKINYFLAAFPGAYFKLSGLAFKYILLYYILLISIFNFPKIVFRKRL